MPEWVIAPWWDTTNSDLACRELWQLPKIGRPWAEYFSSTEPWDGLAAQVHWSLQLQTSLRTCMSRRGLGKVVPIYVVFVDPLWGKLNLLVPGTSITTWYVKGNKPKVLWLRNFIFLAQQFYIPLTFSEDNSYKKNYLVITKDWNYPGGYVEESDSILVVNSLSCGVKRDLRDVLRGSYMISMSSLINISFCFLIYKTEMIVIRPAS